MIRNEKLKHENVYHRDTNKYWGKKNRIEYNFENSLNIYKILLI